MEYKNEKTHGYTLTPTPEQLNVKPEYILRGMGMELKDADDYLLLMIDGLIDECRTMIHPQASFIVHDAVSFDLEHYKTIVSGASFHTGKIVTHSLKKSTSLALFTATCGHEIETYSKRLMREGQTLEGLIVDLIGSETAEAIVEYLHLYVENLAKKSGNNASNRYSPGYCNWPVSDQQKLFPLMKDFDCGIHLTDSSLMLPVKSVSGIIGLGPTLKRADYKCNVCSDVNCIMRRHKE